VRGRAIGELATMRIGPMTPSLLPYSPHRDVYRLLGIPASASTDEINVACRRLARTFHPDRNQSQRATAEMQVVNVVRRVMTDPDERARYDRERRQFHEQAVRSTPAQLRGLRPISDVVADARQPPRPSPTTRYLRAAVVGIRAALSGLAPRCRGCRAVIGGEDAYCASCGTLLLTGG
jgi:curved DNA-binding protein CbpA